MCSLDKSRVSLSPRDRAPTFTRTQRVGPGDERETTDWFGEHIPPTTLWDERNIHKLLSANPPARTDLSSWIVLHAITRSRCHSDHAFASYIIKNGTSKNGANIIILHFTLGLSAADATTRRSNQTVQKVQRRGVLSPLHRTTRQRSTHKKTVNTGWSCQLQRATLELKLNQV